MYGWTVGFNIVQKLFGDIRKVFSCYRFKEGSRA